MTNIPSIHHRSAINAGLSRRSKEPASSEKVAASRQTVKRTLERRHKTDRRQKQLSIRFERRQSAHRRRAINMSNTAENPDTDGTMGKHINITA